MNRLELPAEPIQVPTHTLDTMTLEKQAPVRLRVFGSRGGGNRDDAHTTFAPVHYERNYAYPLVVWLHGAKQDQTHLPEVMSHVSTRNFVAIAPAVGASLSSNGPWQQTPEGIERAESAVLEAINLAASRFHVNPRKIFLVGFDAGGTMALRLGLMHPHRFAGVGSLGGAMPCGHSPLRAINTIRELPLLLSAPLKSLTYDERQFCDDLRLLHSAGCQLTLRQYREDDALTVEMLQDLNGWIMDRIASRSASIIR